MDEMSWIQAVLITGSAIAAAITLTMTYLTYPFAKYLIKHRDTTRQFQVGKIRKPHKLSATDIAGHGEYRLDLITGAAQENTIREWGDLFEVQAQEQGITSIYISAVSRSIRITGWSLNHLQEEGPKIRELINSTNKLYFESLKILRQDAKEMEI